jgi:hypothetical protein
LIDEKRCSKCKSVKSLSDFHKSGSYWCRQCVSGGNKARAERNRQANIGRVLPDDYTKQCSRCREAFPKTCAAP